MLLLGRMGYCMGRVLCACASFVLLSTLLGTNHIWQVQRMHALAHTTSLQMLPLLPQATPCRCPT